MNSIVDEIIRYRMDMVALQEIRWKGKGDIKKKEFTMYFSGDENKQDLQNICDKISKHDAIITLGDFNAKLGREDCFVDIFGKHCLHSETSNNGLKVAQYATMNNFKVVSTWYQKKDIFKGTWRIPGTNQTNQIDHVMISKRWATAIENVRTYRGASSDSDHFLVGVKIKQKIAKITQIKNTGKKIKKWNLNKLEESNIKSRYQEKLKIKFESNDNSNNIEEVWSQIKDNILDTTEEILGEAIKNKNEEWYDDDCRAIIETKRLARLKCLQRNTRANANEYNKVRVTAYRMCRKKKREAIKKRVEEMALHYSMNDTRKFYKKSKEIIQQFCPKTNAVKNLNGDILVESEEILETWRDHFKNMLGKEAEQVDHLKYLSAEPHLKEPSYNEVAYVINSLKNNKSAGLDGITAELIKNGGISLFERIYQLMMMIWTEEKIPEEWTIGIIQPIYKKGDKLICNNYRGITLLNVVYKILSGIIYNRLVVYAEEILGEYQCGFRPFKSTTDNIFILRQIQEKAYEYNIDLFNMYIDFKQAFDSVNREVMYNDLVMLGIPLKLVRLIRTTLTGSKAMVRVNGDMTSSFPINTCVRQGDALSAILFNLVLEATLRKLNPTGHIGNRMVQVCAYADDDVLISRRKSELKEEMKDLIEEATKRGLEINSRKTKYMEIVKNKNKNSERCDFIVDDMIFENVSQFSYLGTQIDEENLVSKEIKNRVMMGNRCYYSYKHIMQSKILNKSLKLKLYHSVIRPKVTYGCETWTLTQKDESLLRIFERKILRKIFGNIRKTDGTWRIRMNYELDELINGADIVRFVKSQRIAWMGHVMRMENDRISKRIMTWNPDGRRSKGRPRTRWRDSVEDDLKIMNVQGWKRLAENRAVWKTVVKQAKTQPGL
ncbi:hypothetical protein C0J52_10468 [Blattella germanica]|nr:hypothetical protein C0J52_10468 [Blattella germanica]